MTRGLFATMPERADTLEAIGQITFAPLLYSMGVRRTSAAGKHACTTSKSSQESRTSDCKQGGT